MITKDSIYELDVETNSPIANNHQRRMTTVRRMYLLIMRKTVAILGWEQWIPRRKQWELQYWGTDEKRGLEEVLYYP